MKNQLPSLNKNVLGSLHILCSYFNLKMIIDNPFSKKQDYNIINKTRRHHQLLFVYGWLRWFSLNCKHYLLSKFCGKFSGLDNLIRIWTSKLKFLKKYETFVCLSEHCCVKFISSYSAMICIHFKNLKKRY